MRSANIAVLLLTVFITTLFTGCNSDFDEIDKLNSRILELEEEKAHLILQYEELEQLNEKKSELTGRINFEDSFVSDIQMTADGKYATLIIYDSFEYTGVYIYDRSNNELTKLGGVNGLSSFWSPDNKHFIVCDYSYLNASCVLFSVETKEQILSFSTNGGTLLWINENEIVYASENREIPLVSETDQYGTVDIIKHNLFTGEIVKLHEGTSQYYYSLQDIDGTIKCYKRYEGTDDKELEYEIVDIFY